MVEDITANKAAEMALRDSEQKFFKAFHGNPTPIVITSRSSGQILVANEAFAQWYGVSYGRTPEWTTFDIGIWRSKAEREQLLQRLQAEGTIRNYERRLTMPTGETRTVVMAIQPMMIGSEDCLLTIATDLTQQKEAEEALQRSEARLRRGLEAARMGTWEWDLASGVVDWTDEAHTLFGLMPGQFPGTFEAFCQLVEPEDRDRVQREIAHALQTPGKNYSSELRVRWPNGTLHWLEGRGDVLRDDAGKPLRMLGTTVDVTERKTVELALRDAQERELRAREEFTAQLLDAEEQERQHLAAELHDGLGQNLSIIKNKAYSALMQPGLPPAVVEHLTAISQAASDTIAELRQMVSNLRPLQLERAGLTEAIGYLVEAVSHSSAVQIQVRIEEIDDILVGKKATQLYRVIQEALNNLVKHSGATKAALHLERDIQCIRLRLSDDGVGFNPDQAPRHSGFGLTSMAERVRMLGGWLRVNSVPGAGTELTLEVPIAESGVGQV
jgi:two-component system sensor histidine kinase UhpB